MCYALKRGDKKSCKKTLFNFAYFITVLVTLLQNVLVSLLHFFISKLNLNLYWVQCRACNLFLEETLSFAWFKVRNKMFLLYLRKVSLTKCIRYKDIQMECREPFYERVTCLHVTFFRKTLIGCFAYFQNVVGWRVFVVPGPRLESAFDGPDSSLYLAAPALNLYLPTPSPQFAFTGPNWSQTDHRHYDR